MERSEIAVKNKRFVGVMWELLEQILETEELSEALSGALEMLTRILNCEAGAVWLLDRNADRLVPVFHKYQRGKRSRRGRARHP